ncbi:Uncharacterised protein [Vibrio cholerae]|nr:Uncharacterised protein [Vibrio cholerae]
MVSFSTDLASSTSARGDGRKFIPCVEHYY